MTHDFQEKPRDSQAGEKWVVVKQWAGGRGRLETEKFKTAANWRISWKTTTGDPDPIGTLSISVRKGTGELVKMANNLGQKIASGSLAIPGAGEYYLEIESADRNWQVSVEQRPS
jgi:hypothetical protein